MMKEITKNPNNLIEDSSYDLLVTSPRINWQPKHGDRNYLEDFENVLNQFKHQKPKSRSHSTTTVSYCSECS